METPDNRGDKNEQKAEKSAARDGQVCGRQKERKIQPRLYQADRQDYAEEYVSEVIAAALCCSVLTALSNIQPSDTLRFSVLETRLSASFKKMDMPTLVLHGDDDQIVPIGHSAKLTAKLVKGSTLKVIPGAPHGMCSTHKDLINNELLTFIRG